MRAHAAAIEAAYEKAITAGFTEGYLKLAQCFLLQDRPTEACNALEQAQQVGEVVAASVLIEAYERALAAGYMHYRPKLAKLRRSAVTASDSPHVE